jgi:hypothetical protein
MWPLPAGNATVRVVVNGQAISDAQEQTSRVVKQAVGDLCAGKTTAQVAAEASALATAKVGAEETTEHLLLCHRSSACLRSASLLILDSTQMR